MVYVSVHSFPLSSSPNVVSLPFTSTGDNMVRVRCFYQNSSSSGRSAFVESDLEDASKPGTHPLAMTTWGSAGWKQPGSSLGA